MCCFFAINGLLFICQFLMFFCNVLFKSFVLKLQLVRSNSRRSMPSQADEEAHQLSYLQKHLGNILSLLAESVEGDGEESLVCGFYSVLYFRYCCFICLG